MINHIRTLLLNSQPSNEPFEEFIPTGYMPIPLKRAEAAVQNKLVPPSFPRRTRNYLATLLFKIADTFPLYEWPLPLDKRVALSLGNENPSILPVLSVKSLGGDVVKFSGSLNPLHDVGVFYRKWMAHKVNGTTIALIESPSSQITTVNLTFNGDFASPVEIGQSGIFVGVRGGTEVPAFSSLVEASYPFAFNAVEAVQLLRSDNDVYGVFSFSNQLMAQKLMEIFRSERADLALGAIVLAYSIHLSERNSL